MGTLEKHLRAARDCGRKLLVPYVTGGITEDWLDIVRAFDDAGADAIEIGIPFSDPVMDGPTIQEASEVALARGANPPEILAELRSLDIGTPLVAMTYANLPFRMGFERFAAECAAVGVHGVILPDIPMEELDEWEAASAGHDVDTVLLASQLTPDDRLATICARSAGFVYGVNLLGVTGARDSVAESALELARRLKATTDLPAVMGFGVSGPDQAVTLAAESDGVVIASALMRRILDGDSIVAVGDFLATVRAALDAG